MILQRGFCVERELTYSEKKLLKSCITPRQKGAFRRWSILLYIGLVVQAIEAWKLLCKEMIKTLTASDLRAIAIISAVAAFVTITAKYYRRTDIDSRIVYMLSYDKVKGFDGIIQKDKSGNCSVWVDNRHLYTKNLVMSKADEWRAIDLPCTYVKLGDETYAYTQGAVVEGLKRSIERDVRKFKRNRA